MHLGCVKNGVQCTFVCDILRLVLQNVIISHRPHFEGKGTLPLNWPLKMGGCLSLLSNDGRVNRGTGGRETEHELKEREIEVNGQVFHERLEVTTTYDEMGKRQAPFFDTLCNKRSDR